MKKHKIDLALIFGRRVPVLDKDGKPVPVLNKDGRPILTKSGRQKFKTTIVKAKL